MIARKTLELTSFTLFLLITVAIYCAFTFQRNFDWASELTLWEDAKVKSPSKSRPYTYAGVAHAKNKNLKEAHSNLSKAIMLDPSDIEARYNISVLYMEIDRYDLAEAELKSAIESRPELKESYIALAELYAKTDRVSDAADILTKADRVWPENLIIRLKLATAWAKSNRFKEAEAEYKWVLKRAPLATAAINGLGNIYMIQRKYSLALSYYERAIELRPDEPEAIYNAALILEELGDFKRAMEFYSLFINAASDSATPYVEAIKRSKQRIRILKESG